MWGVLDLEGGIVWSLTFFQLWALMGLLFFFCVSLPQYCFNLTQNVSHLLFRPITNQLISILRCLQWLLIGYARHIELKLMKSMNLKILQLIFDEIKQLGLGMVVWPQYYFCTRPFQASLFSPTFSQLPIILTYSLFFNLLVFLFFLFLRMVVPNPQNWTLLIAFIIIFFNFQSSPGSHHIQESLFLIGSDNYFFGHNDYFACLCLSTHCVL